MGPPLALLLLPGSQTRLRARPREGAVRAGRRHLLVRRLCGPLEFADHARARPQRAHHQRPLGESAARDHGQVGGERADDEFLAEHPELHERLGCAAHRRPRLEVRLDHQGGPGRRAAAHPPALAPEAAHGPERVHGELRKAIHARGADDVRRPGGGLLPRLADLHEPRRGMHWRPGLEGVGRGPFPEPLLRQAWRPTEKRLRYLQRRRVPRCGLHQPRCRCFPPQEGRRQLVRLLQPDEEPCAAHIHGGPAVVQGLHEIVRAVIHARPCALAEQRSVSA
mmetsp:Transcript_82511/g.212582  ORF Transcript_82511/g.212582 Transcript_82511/m.212582 type:complete len:280 (-) Transcript_82511:267-1106(-)